jgi:hypothetical protein
MTSRKEDRPTVPTDIEVTTAMVKAGVSVLSESDTRCEHLAEMAVDVFAAMARAAARRGLSGGNLPDGRD